MKCNYNIEDLVNLIEDTVDEESRIELEHHIEKCSKCNKNYTALKLADNLMQKEVKYSKDLYNNLIVRIDENRYKSQSLKYRIGFIFYKNVPKLKIILTATVIILLLITAKSIFPFNKSSINKYNSSKVVSQNSTTIAGKEDSFNEYDIESIPLEFKNVDVIQSIEEIDKSVIEKIYTEKNIAGMIVFIFKNSKDEEFLHGGIKIDDTYYDLGEVSAILLEEYPDTISIEEINYCNLKLLRIYGIVGGAYFGKTSYYVFHDGKPNNFLTVNGRGIERDIDNDGKEEIISCSGPAPYTYLYEYEDGYIKLSDINLKLNADGVFFDNDSNIFKAYYGNDNGKIKLFEYNGKEMVLVDLR